MSIKVIGSRSNEKVIFYITFTSVYLHASMVKGHLKAKVNVIQHQGQMKGNQFYCNCFCDLYVVWILGLFAFFKLKSNKNETVRMEIKIPTQHSKAMNNY